MGCPAVGRARQVTRRDRNKGTCCVQAAVSVMAFFFFGRGITETCSEGRKSRPETETGGQLAPGN